MATSFDPNFREVIERFEKTLRGRSLQPQTVHAYLVDAIQFLTWLEETRASQPETVTASIAQAYLESLRAPTSNRPASYSASTICRKIKSLRYFYDSFDDSMNPFAELTLPLQNRPITKLSSRQLASLLDAPLETSAAGVRDRALLQLITHGISLFQLHNLDLKHIDPDAHFLLLPTQSIDQGLVLLLESAWMRLQRWLVIRKLFAVNTEAVFVSLHWTAGRSQPGSRLSERSMRTVITRYLAEIGAKQPGVNSLLIAKSANDCASS